MFPKFGANLASTAASAAAVSTDGAGAGKAGSSGWTSTVLSADSFRSKEFARGPKYEQYQRAPGLGMLLGSSSGTWFELCSCHRGNSHRLKHAPHDGFESRPPPEKEQS